VSIYRDLLLPVFLFSMSLARLLYCHFIFL